MSSNLSIKKICENCNKEFIAKTLYTRYCCQNCNRRHYKKLKRQEVINEVLNQQPAIKILNTPLSEKEFLSVTETAILIGASKRTIHRLISNGKLCIGKIGSRTIIRRTEIDKLFKQS